MYPPRTYRHRVKDESLVAFQVVVKETDLYIRALSNLHRKAYRLVEKYRIRTDDPDTVLLGSE